jgi:hypothetical protein
VSHHCCSDDVFGDTTSTQEHLGVGFLAGFGDCQLKAGARYQPGDNGSRSGQRVLEDIAS